MGQNRLVLKVRGLVIGESGKSPIDDDLGVGHSFRFFVLCLCVMECAQA